MTYYDDLGISPDASAEELRQAFRRKARGLHPDKPGGDAEKMAQANRAYETLSDPRRRLTYDRTGEDKPANVDALAQELVLSMVVNWLAADHERPDMIGDISAHFDKEQNALLQKIVEAGALLARMRKRLLKLKRKGKGPDFVRVAVEFRINEVRQQTEKIRDQADRLDRAKELLQSYEFEADPAPAERYAAAPAMRYTVRNRGGAPP